jgi:HD-GYP domain-containing protein (c-di-GMP phosphodiesterase class II)
MARLAEILKKQEMDRMHFQEYKSMSLGKLSNDSGVLTAENLYRELLDTMRQVLSDILNAKQLDLTALKDKIGLVCDWVVKDDGTLLKLVDRNDDLEDYLVVHSVNTCILSLEIGRGLDYNRQMMLDLGLGAFLHDIGMIKINNILKHKRKLYVAEYNEVKEHVNYGVEILHNLDQSNNRIVSIIRDHHERRDGSGYLKGLSGEQVDEPARIVGLADVYEAMVHSRPHRNKFEPFEYETIREIISNKGLFDTYILKVFLERLTRHPAYMLWLATSGIYELLEQQKKEPEELEIKPSGKKKYALILAYVAILAVALVAGRAVFLPDVNLADREIFYPLGNSLGIAENKQPLAIAYNFTDNSNTNSVSLDLTGMNLRGYHFLSLSSKLNAKEVKKTRYATFKIVIENLRKETASYYIQGINNNWREFRIPLSYFDTISDWSSLKSISLVLQPWNIDSKQGTLYVDNIHFFRKK